MPILGNCKVFFKGESQQPPQQQQPPPFPAQQQAQQPQPAQPASGPGSFDVNDDDDLGIPF